MKRYPLLVVVLLAALVVPTMVGAQSETLPGSGWWTGQQIQNIGTGAATIVSTAYDSASGATYMASAGPIAAGNSITFLPADFSGMPNGFQGSAVVASDQPIKAIVALTNRKVGSYGVDGGLAAGQYQGIDGSAAATTVRFPIVKNAYGASPNIKTVTMFVQNAGSAAATVHAVYKCGNGSTYTWDSPSINPGQMTVVNASQASVPTNQLCAGTMSSTQPIAGVATEHYATETVATLVQATRGFTPADYASKIYAPIFKKKYPNHATQGRTTGAQVQNVGSSDITVTATFAGSSAPACPPGTIYTVTSPTIPPDGSYTFLNPAGMPDGCLSSATFDAGTGQIVGIVNESYLTPAPAPGTQSSTAYNMMAGGSAATTKVAIPLFKEKYGNKTSGLQVMNIGTVTTTIHVEFKTSTATYTTVDVDVAPGASQNYFLVSNTPGIFVGGTVLPAGSNASALVYSTGSAQLILAAVAESPWYPTAQNCFGQGTVVCYDKMNYEGFNVAP